MLICKEILKQQFLFLMLSFRGWLPIYFCEFVKGGKSLNRLGTRDSIGFKKEKLSFLLEELADFKT